MRFVALFSHDTGIVGQVVLPQYITFMVSAFRLGSLFEGNIYYVGMPLSSGFVRVFMQSTTNVKRVL